MSTRPSGLFRCGEDEGRMPRAMAGDAQAFLVRLREIRSAESLMTLQEFLAAYRDSTGTSSEEALQALDALHRAGVVLHMGTRIFLNPGDIVAQLSRVLPSHAHLSSERLREAESELEAMEAQRRGLEASSRRMRHLAQWGALAALVLPWAVLFRLTYWELSWDVTEPLGFFFGGLTTILSYLWYMRHQHDFTWSHMHNRMIGAWERRAFERAAFDAARYELLKRRVRAYRELFEAEVHEEGVGQVEQALSEVTKRAC
ncbi:DUF607 hypothetical protein [Helicosporidium sp. ATCC 50920]|nr:DUF607 hypothetical protein [Helicosporidium sp. ATCC 50920]|eukprot:KDD76150.1 DUF607 hypothetical protein [Helicosporidium sp. ATCC 50920]